MIQTVRSWGLLIALGVVTGSLHAASPLPVEPIILLMVGDDIGWGDIGCDGSTQIKTPNIDRMAKEGMRFTSGYATAALCSPSRAALLTGRYQQRNGLENNRLAETKHLAGENPEMLDQLNKAWNAWNATLPPRVCAAQTSATQTGLRPGILDLKSHDP